MPHSLSEYLENDMECEDLLECVSGSKDLDKEIYFLVLEEKSLSIDDIAEKVNRERSTVYRAVQRLAENGFLRQEKVGQDGGGYRHMYSAVEPEVIAQRMQDQLNKWYAQMGQLIHEFKNKYPEEP